MAKTTERPLYLDKLDPIEAARRVGDYIAAPQRSGPWSIEPFTVTPDGAQIDYLRSLGDGGGRWTPPGDYLKLANDDEEIGVMMSNTPDEINDHNAAFTVAEGRVLVSGLGLSCVVSGLLAVADVQHIDVIELDEDVIRLVGPAFANDPRVTIHHGDVLTYEWPEGSYWDFAWHDIWSKISSDNLEPEDIEGKPQETGVSYREVFERYGPMVGAQNAWALKEAVVMDECYRLAGEQARQYTEDWKTMSEDERIDLIISFTHENPVTKALGFSTSVAELRKLYDSQGQLDRIREAAKSDFSPAFMPSAQHFREEAAERMTELVEAKIAEWGMEVSSYEYRLSPKLREPE